MGRSAMLLLHLQAGHKQVTSAKVKVAINGFGRIGRNFLRCWNGRENSLLDVVAINDSGGVKQVHIFRCRTAEGAAVIGSGSLQVFEELPGAS